MMHISWHIRLQDEMIDVLERFHISIWYQTHDDSRSAINQLIPPANKRLFYTSQIDLPEGTT